MAVLDAGPAAVPPAAGSRRRSMVALFTGVAALSTAMVGASAVATLITAREHGDGWSGVPNAAGVLGTAIGSLWMGVLVARQGQRSALRLMYGLAALGGLVAFAAAGSGSLLPLCVGLGLLGVGNSAANLSRYLAAELYPAQRRAFGLSVLVWAGTVGALFGPTLVAPAAGLAGWFGLPELSGPLAAAALLSAVAMVAGASLPRPVDSGRSGPARAPLSRALVRSALRRRSVLVPLTAMAGAHVAMVGVMTMTPLQLTHLGHGLHTLGIVLSAHMVGMFVLAPVSGRIADRCGGGVAVTAGTAVLVAAAAVIVAAPTAAGTGLPLALFLLGYGWNLVFVGGSALLSRDLPEAERAQLQGLVDALVWGASALASMVAGQLFGLGGYGLVAVAAAVAAVAPALARLGRPVRAA